MGVGGLKDVVLLCGAELTSACGVSGEFDGGGFWILASGHALALAWVSPKNAVLKSVMTYDIIVSSIIGA